MPCRALCLSFVVGFDSATAPRLLKISKCFPKKAVGDNRGITETQRVRGDQTLISASHNTVMFLLLTQKCK